MDTGCFYEAIGGLEVTHLMLALNTIGIVMFMAGFVFGLYNLMKFRRWLSFPMVLLYATAMMSLFSRVAYFSLNFVMIDTFYNLILIVLPIFLSLSVVLSQILIYIVLDI